MASKAAQIARVARQLDGLLDDLAVTVGALNDILTRTADPEPGAGDERLVSGE